MDTSTALLRLLLLAAVVLAGVLLVRGRPSGASLAGAGAPSGGTLARVVRVVDGDTIHVSAAGGRELTVRYIGIDTPESVKPDTPVQCYAKAASHRNAALVTGQQVRLVVGAEPRDKYGRLLAYVYRVADGAFVNEALIREGFARPLAIAPNTRFAARFGALATAARQARRGLWGSC